MMALILLVNHKPILFIAITDFQWPNMETMCTIHQIKVICVIFVNVSTLSRHLSTLSNLSLMGCDLNIF